MVEPAMKEQLRRPAGATLMGCLSLLVQCTDESDGAGQEDENGFRVWTEQFGSEFPDNALDVAVDGDGNVYVVGHTAGELDGGQNGTPGPTQEYGAEDIDGFLRKYDAAGVEQWTRQFFTGEMVSVFVALDRDSNVYVAGNLEGGGDTGNDDGYVRKFNADGEEQWVEQFGPIQSYDYVTSLATDGNGDVYVTGYAYRDLNAPSSVGFGDGYLRKFSRDGGLLWNNQFGGEGSQNYTSAVVTDASDNVYVAGSTWNASTSGPYLRKYDTEGVEHWTQELTAGGFGRLSAATTDGSENLYVVGYTDAELDDVYVLVGKYDSNGAEQWIEQFGSGGLEDQFAYAISTDEGGNLYIAGETREDLDGDGGADRGRRGYEAYVRKYDATGALQWTEQFGTSENDSAQGVALDGSDRVYVAGSTWGDLDGGGNPQPVDAYITLIER